jgi:transketolase
MPCVERFLELPGDEQRRLIPRGKARLVAVEAAIGIDWYRIVGEGLVVGIDRFGASAPEKALAEAYGLTPQRVAGRISKWLSEGR